MAEDVKNINEDIPHQYRYDTREEREATVLALYTFARTERALQESMWRRYDRYYNFLHDVSDETRQALKDKGLPVDTMVLADPFIQIESQIIPNVPEPEFIGRDDDQDNKKAKQRELVVKYVLQNNSLDEKNTSNERRLLKYGDAFWKVYWDENMRPDKIGDIRVTDIPIESLFIDPAVKNGGTEEAQY
ncbi:MAG: hypothetical protein WCP73_03200, partial [Eubacteriales bacterium]